MKGSYFNNKVLKNDCQVTEIERERKMLVLEKFVDGATGQWWAGLDR